jgi:hypothetical protein
VLVAVALVAVLASAVGAALVLRRPREPEPVRFLAAAAPAPVEISGEVDPVAALDALLAELERTTVRIDGADELDACAVDELEALARRLEAAAEALAAG